MLKIIGALFLISGSMGYGMCLSRNLQNEIQEIKSFIYMFQLFKSAISYRKETLPDATSHAGKKISGQLGVMLCQVAQEMEKNRKKTFSTIWKIEGENYFKTSFLKKQLKEYILKFPEYIGFSDENMQVVVIDEYVSELESHLLEMEKKIVDRKRVILGVSVVGGMILTIILL